MSDEVAKEVLVDSIMDGTAREVMQVKCPTCDGPLRIQVSTRREDKSKKQALSVMCPSCLWRHICDGIPKEPIWVGELGHKITTGTTSH